MHSRPSPPHCRRCILQMGGVRVRTTKGTDRSLTEEVAGEVDVEELHESGRVEGGVDKTGLVHGGEAFSGDHGGGRGRGRGEGTTATEGGGWGGGTSVEGRYKNDRDGVSTQSWPAQWVVMEWDDLRWRSEEDAQLSVTRQRE